MSRVKSLLIALAVGLVALTVTTSLQYLGHAHATRSSTVNGK